METIQRIGETEKIYYGSIRRAISFFQYIPDGDQIGKSLCR